MRLTTRDLRMLKDMALSHVLSRDQLILLGYFGSVTRTNTRLRELAKAEFVRPLLTPFFTQGLYGVGPKAIEVLGERIATLVNERTGSPRFLQHALAVSNVRIHLQDSGANSWRFEQQLRSSFTFAGHVYEVRPDGMAVFGNRLVAVEADLGHVAPGKFAEKIASYHAFVESGECKKQWLEDDFELLVVTTGRLRTARLTRCISQSCSYRVIVVTHSDAGIAFPGAWS